MRNKVFNSFDEAVADIPNGAVIAMDSWAIAATAQNLIAALKRKGTKDITVITHCFIPMIFSEESAVMPAVLLPLAVSRTPSAWALLSKRGKRKELSTEGSTFWRSR